MHSEIVLTVVNSEMSHHFGGILYVKSPKICDLFGLH